MIPVERVSILYQRRTLEASFLGSRDAASSEPYRISQATPMLCIILVLHRRKMFLPSGILGFRPPQSAPSLLTLVRSLTLGYLALGKGRTVTNPFDDGLPRGNPGSPGVTPTVGNSQKLTLL